MNLHLIAVNYTYSQLIKYLDLMLWDLLSSLHKKSPKSPTLCCTFLLMFVMSGIHYLLI